METFESTLYELFKNYGDLTGRVSALKNLVDKEHHRNKKRGYGGGSLEISLIRSIFGWEEEGESDDE